MKKFGFFVFACALGSSYAMASSGSTQAYDCEGRCEAALERCRQSQPQPNYCYTNYLRCIKPCRN